MRHFEALNEEYLIESGIALWLGVGSFIFKFSTTMSQFKEGGYPEGYED